MIELSIIINAILGSLFQSKRWILFPRVSWNAVGTNHKPGDALRPIIEDNNVCSIVSSYWTLDNKKRVTLSWRYWHVHFNWMECNLVPLTLLRFMNILCWLYILKMRIIYSNGFRLKSSKRLVASCNQKACQTQSKELLRGMQAR